MLEPYRLATSNLRIGLGPIEGIVTCVPRSVRCLLTSGRDEIYVVMMHQAMSLGGARTSLGIVGRSILL